MKLRKYTLEQLKEAIITSYSYRETLSKLNVSNYGGNYQVLKNAINHFNLNISHFTHQAWSKNKIFGPKRNIEEYLTNNQPISSYKLKNRLIKENYFQHICSNCKLETWLNCKIPLELDHINGDNKDNSLSNLRLLCPNCHAQTPTYRGKNQERHRKFS